MQNTALKWPENVSMYILNFNSVHTKCNNTKNVK